MNFSGKYWKKDSNEKWKFQESTWVEYFLTGKLSSIKEEEEELFKCNILKEHV